MNEEQISSLLVSFRDSQHYKLWRPRRVDRHKYNHSWIEPKKIETMPDDELKSKFIEYFSGGEGRQVLIQIWRRRIIEDVSKFRRMLVYLLDESMPVEERFSNVVSSSGNKHIEGVGKGLASAFLMDFNLQKYCIWNNKTEMGFNVIGWETPYQGGDSEGIKYIKVLEQLKKLRDDIASGLNYNYDDIDNFLHWIAAEEEGIKAVEQLIGKDVLTETGMALTHDERLVQQLLERNFDKIFSSLNLQLYDGDPDQTGGQFNTLVGRIDFLAVDKNTEDFVVIELKVGQFHESAIGQILRYMGHVKRYLAGDKNVKGVILAEDIDDKGKDALSLVPAIEFKKYKLDIQVI